MMTRVLKLLPIFLLTLNMWAGCCCNSSGCASEVPKCSESVEVMAAHEPGESMSGHHEASAHPPTSKRCHSKEKYAKMAFSGHQETNAPGITNTCNCGNHQKTQTDNFALLSLKEISISVPLILFALAWAEVVLQPTQQPVSQASTAFLVSPRWAPSLSVLGRFLI